MEMELILQGKHGDETVEIWQRTGLGTDEGSSAGSFAGHGNNVTALLSGGRCEGKRSKEKTKASDVTAFFRSSFPTHSFKQVVVYR